MAYTRKSLEELNIMDDFLIHTLATDEKVGEAFCRETLSVLLQRKIGAIRIVTQKTIPALTPGMRGIRMDVEIVEDLGEDGHLPAVNIYDLEPHIPNNMDLLRHNRFYQAKIDSRYLKSGERAFYNMPNLFVITILNYDPFGYGYMMYTVNNQCREVPELEYKDGLFFIYFYTGGTKGGTPEMKAMLNYFKESTAENAVDESTKRIHNYASYVRTEPEVRDAYMKFDDIIYWQRQDAAKEAAEQATKEATQKATKVTIVHCICDLLEKYGELPLDIVERLDNENDIEVLTQWHKLAAEVSGMKEFSEKIMNEREKRTV